MIHAESTISASKHKIVRAKNIWNKHLLVSVAIICYIRGVNYINLHGDNLVLITLFIERLANCYHWSLARLDIILI